MGGERACPHCGSPARQNPCWWFIKHPQYPTDGGDPPCLDDAYADRATKRERRSRGNFLLFALVTIAVASLIVFYLMVKS